VTDAGGAPKRGKLRIYLGAAPGVGKTFAMLNEGRRRAERGTDVVVGLVETHGRQRTAEQLGDLEVVPRRTLTHRGSALAEMDTEAVLRRRPQLVLVDELAHTNVPGSRHEKRWQDVQDLLAAGIDVISTVNIQHLESLNDVVERITGIHQRETIPDRVVRAADDIELVDMAPEALRRRLAHGNVYGADKIDAALANYFRAGNLSALRELALLWVADRVDDSMQDYRDRHGITRPWETRERIIVALAGAPDTDHVIRRAARMSQRAKGDLIGVRVISDTGLTSGNEEATAEVAAEQRRLLEELGGEYRQITSNDVAAALVDLARSENATQIVLGASARSRWQELLSGSVINTVVRSSGPIDVHVISRRPEGDEGDQRRRLPPVRRVVTPLSRRRQLWGWVLVLAGLPLITVTLANLRGTIGLASVLLLYLLLAIAVAFVGGIMPAGVAVVGGFLLANWFFTPPYYVFSITDGENVLALAVYAISAGTVAVLVDRIGRIRLRAARLQAEAEALASLAGALARPGPLGEMLGQLRATFGFRAASLLRGDGPRWEVIVSSGPEPPERPDDADVSRGLGRGVTLALAGGALSGEDERMLSSFAAQVAAAAERERLQTEAGRAEDLAAANTLRASLLQAVSHDLRTPLASIKASISSLRQRDIEWPPEAIDEFQTTIDEETDRLTHIVGNLLDMSRLQAAALNVERRPSGVEEVVIAAVAGLGSAGRGVDIDVPETLPDVSADPALLEQALANLIGNAVRYAPAGVPVRVTAGEVLADQECRVDIRVIDRGAGIRQADRDLVFQPFQRVVDNQAGGGGVGLGLAIARGFVEAMGGELTIEDTPGGGATMVVGLPAAAQVRPP
jgi:two-component system, OmpR family, sensor histidine kinase KdpD